MPGTTHARAAQPVTLGHHLLAHAWALLRDLERFDQWAVADLGVAARGRRARHVDARARSRRDGRRDSGSRRAFDNSIDAVSRPRLRAGVPGRRRDLRDASLAAGGRSRPVDRPVARVGGARRGLHDRVEHHAAEAEPRHRGARARRRPRAIAGGFVALTSVLQGLPLGYHRDLQEDKEPAFDAADTLELVLPGDGGSRRHRCGSTPRRCGRPPRDDGLYATDLAEALVRGGVPFREAHRRTGDAAEGARRARARPLRDLTAGGVGGVRRRRRGGAARPGRLGASADHAGGPSPASVTAQAEAVAAALAARAGRG